MSLMKVLNAWKTDEYTAPNIFNWQSTPARPASLLPLPADLDPALIETLQTEGIFELYSHQHAAWTLAQAKQNIVLATGTASGKSLAYNLPVVDRLINQPNARALYLFPTKALAQDQLSGLKQLQGNFAAIKAAVYDGDTPVGRRREIRKHASILFSNPDMLHTGILPHHVNWSDFFTNLNFVIIDEMHTYRGVFGSHVANVIRRLKRVAAFYGAKPQFILTSATIANPQQLAEMLIEAPVKVIDQDGSARGERHLITYNPPIVDAALGVRKSALKESVRLGQALMKEQVQTVLFARSRRSVEMILNDLQKSATNSASEIRGYRSGYLPSQRREIEKGLRDGSVQLVVATNALELGIDIGGLGAAILAGYPGSVASLIQQAGRAGRGNAAAAAIFIATPDPLDQFLAHHPEYFLKRSPEQALINANHLLILLNHLRCAMFELPFQNGDSFGNLPADNLQEYLDFLVSNQEAHHSSDQYFWMADTYPAANVSLRTASPVSIALQSVDEDGRPEIIGTVDAESAVWMVHPGAVYLHEAQQFFVQELNLQTHTAQLIPVALDYFTEPLKETTLEVLDKSAQENITGGTKHWGELKVTNIVTGFRKRRWHSGEVLGQENLDLPPSDLQTTGYWISISDETVEKLAAEGLWTNNPNDYGADWPKIRQRVRERDQFTCQLCGAAESPNRQHDVHHKIPFRQFKGEGGQIIREQANNLQNLITLCPSCHKKAEANVRMRSGLAGLGYVLSQLAPLFLMCDPRDLGRHTEPLAVFANGQPAVVLYDLVPAGIGFSQKLFEIHAELMNHARQLVQTCGCEDGCPSCVGPAGENGMGGKAETLALLNLIK